MKANDSGIRTKQLKRANNKRIKIRAHKEHSNKWQQDKQERRKRNERNAMCQDTGLCILGLRKSKSK